MLVFFVAVLKTALNIALIRALGETWPRAFLSAVLLAQLGEFSFILAAQGLAVAAIGGEGHRLLVAVTVLSLVMSSVWLEAARRLHRVALLGLTSGRERSEEHTSELQSLMRTSYAVFCLINTHTHHNYNSSPTQHLSSIPS